MYFELRLKKNYYTHITIIENCNSFKEELFLHQHKFRVLVTKQKIVLPGLIDLFRNDFSIPQTPRGPQLSQIYDRYWIELGFW